MYVAKIATHWTKEETQAIWQAVCNEAREATPGQVVAKVREFEDGARRWKSQASQNRIYGRAAAYASEMAAMWSIVINYPPAGTRSE